MTKADTLGVFETYLHVFITSPCLLATPSDTYCNCLLFKVRKGSLEKLYPLTRVTGLGGKKQCLTWAQWSDSRAAPLILCPAAP